MSTKAKILAGGARSYCRRNHQYEPHLINNYTNAGLSILFLVVVYSIIFYGIRTANESL